MNPEPNTTEMKLSLHKLVTSLLHLVFVLMLLPPSSHASPLIIDHNCTDLSQIPSEWINTVKNNTALYYAHTSHGEQLTVGLDTIESANPYYSIARSYWNLPNENNTFNIYEPDIYNYWDYTTSVPDTLTTYPSINFSMYSWCMQLKEYTSQQVQDYLDSMATLEVSHPEIIFIYMTGNAQDTWGDGYNRYLRNEQIRDWVSSSDNRILFDFADLDSWWYNPDTQQWEQATYEYNGHIYPVEHPHFHGDEAKHTTYESCEQKGMALWWMMARLLEWDPGTATTTTVGSSTTTTTSPATTTTSADSTTTTIDDNCILEEIYGEYSKEVELLRYFRDNVLGKTTAGREIIKLYYQYSHFIVKAINEDKGFREELRLLIDKLLPLFRT